MVCLGLALYRRSAGATRIACRSAPTLVSFKVWTDEVTRDLKVAATALSALFAAICFVALPERPAKPAILLAWIHMSAIVDAATDCSEELPISFRRCRRCMFDYAHTRHIRRCEAPARHRPGAAPRP
jgi:hypothetical protein